MSGRCFLATASAPSVCSKYLGVCGSALMVFGANACILTKDSNNPSWLCLNLTNQGIAIHSRPQPPKASSFAKRTVECVSLFFFLC